VFTGFPSDKAVLSQQDSALLKDILTVSVAIQKDSFNMAMIDQVDITSQRIFEMVPKIGNTIIVFGDATDVAAKFYKLQLFYKEVMVKTGWNKYSEINVQYNGQVVAKRKGAEDKSTDSLRTLQLMQAIAENTERLSNDSLHMIATDNENNTTNIDLVQQSIQRDDEPGGSAGDKPVPSIVPVVRPAAVAKRPAVLMPKPASAVVKKPVVTKPAGTVARPKPAVVKPAVKPLVKPKALLPKPVAKPPVKKPGNEY
jgi:cell division protein FtsQ